MAIEEVETEIKSEEVFLDLERSDIDKTDALFNNKANITFRNT